MGLAVVPTQVVHPERRPAEPLGGAEAAGQGGGASVGTASPLQFPRPPLHLGEDEECFEDVPLVRRCDLLEGGQGTLGMGEPLSEGQAAEGVEGGFERVAGRRPHPVVGPPTGGLPDPGLARQQDEPAGAGSGGVERHPQPVDELPAPDETNNLALRQEGGVGFALGKGRQDRSGVRLLPLPVSPALPGGLADGDRLGQSFQLPRPEVGEAGGS